MVHGDLATLERDSADTASDPMSGRRGRNRDSTLRVSSFELVYDGRRPARRTRHESKGDQRVTDDAEAMGPISYLIVEFPGNKMTGEGFAALLDLVDRGVIRILDLEFVTRRDDGSIAGLQLRDVSSDGQFDLTIFEGASSGLLDQSDYDDAAERHPAGLLGGDPPLRESLGDVLHPGPPRRWCRAGRGRLHPARRHCGFARRDRSQLTRHTTRERTRACQDCSEESPAPQWSPARQRRSPTACHGARPIAGPTRRRRSTPSSRSTTNRHRRYAAPAPPPPAAAPDPIAQLKELAHLKDQGILTEEEFAAQKARILGS